MSGYWSGRECVCGLEIPHGTDWEPRCRHCERIHISRGLLEVTDETE